VRGGVFDEAVSDGGRGVEGEDGREKDEMGVVVVRGGFETSLRRSRTRGVMS